VTNSPDLIDLDLLICKECDPGVATAIRKWASGLTLSHSVASRQFPIQQGLREYVDPEVERVLKEFSGTTRNLKELEGFVLSRCWTTLPKEVSGPLKGSNQFEEKLFRANEWRMRLRCTIRGREEQAVMQLRRRLEALQPGIEKFPQWRDIIPGLEPVSQRPELKRLVDTLDTLVWLIHACSKFEPTVSKTIKQEAVERRLGDTQTHCDLCWRLTESKVDQESRLGEPSIGGLSSASPSMLSELHDLELDMKNQWRERQALHVPGRLQYSKFLCHEHAGSTSAYAAAYARKAEFDAELNYLLELIKVPGQFSREAVFSWREYPDNSGGMRLVVLPSTRHPEDVRRAAYARVHAPHFLRRREQILYYSDGLKMSAQDISAQLSISVRTVQDNLKELKEKKVLAWMCTVARTAGDRPSGVQLLVS